MELELINYFWAFVISFVLFLALDFLWLGWVAKDLYGKQLKNKLKSPINWPVVSIFYTVFIVGLNYFVIIPALNQSSLVVAALSGLLYGFLIYAAFNLMSYATLKSSPKKIAIVDIVWGSILSMSVAVITYNLYIGILA